MLRASLFSNVVSHLCSSAVCPVMIKHAVGQHACAPRSQSATVHVRGATVHRAGASQHPLSVAPAGGGGGGGGEGSLPGVVAAKPRAEGNCPEPAGRADPGQPGGPGPGRVQRSRCLLTLWLRVIHA